MGGASRSTVAAAIGTLGMILLVTTAVLPGRQTPAVEKAGFGGIADVARASIGG